MSVKAVIKLPTINDRKKFLNGDAITQTLVLIGNKTKDAYETAWDRGQDMAGGSLPRLSKAYKAWKTNVKGAAGIRDFSVDGHMRDGFSVRRVSRLLVEMFFRGIENAKAAGNLAKAPKMLKISDKHRGEMLKLFLLRMVKG